MKLVNEYLNQGNQIQTFGPLIHNIPVLNNLTSLGVSTVNSVKEIDKKKTLCIRTHGISREVEKFIKKQGVSTLDATCPLVKKEQQIIEKLDKMKGSIIIVGDKDHPEIVAARSYAEHVLIIDSLAAAKALPSCKQLSVVAQTTLSEEFFKQVVAILIDKTEKLEIFNTICQATKDRQQAIKKLAPKVDAIIVIGSKISSNTKKLFHIAKGINKKSLHIETCTDLQKPKTLNKLRKFSSIGISAGASTAPEEIERVKNFLQKL